MCQNTRVCKNDSLTHTFICGLFHEISVEFEIPLLIYDLLSLNLVLRQLLFLGAELRIEGLQIIQTASPIIPAR